MSKELTLETAKKNERLLFKLDFISITGYVF